MFEMSHNKKDSSKQPVNYELALLEAETDRKLGSVWKKIKHVLTVLEIGKFKNNDVISTSANLWVVEL